ncbi:hypothetical protein MN608_11884 [Microdochium nivale]|nr:hypothetical protein MN608_11884 [Microdochium nivale]
MKFSAVAIFAASASAAAIKRQDSPVFDVTDFEASCIPHSSQCKYSFKVKQHASMETEGVSCSALVTADGLNILPAVPEGTCEQSSRTWTIIKSVSKPSNLALFVSQPISPSSNITGVHTIQADELAISTPENPNGAVQSYIGCPEFGLDAPYSG